MSHISYTDNGPRGVTMKKYSFSVDGIPVEIYSLSESECATGNDHADSEKKSIKVMLTTDLQNDFRVEYFSNNNTKPREPHIPIAALSCFFKRVRGYPDMALDIAIDDRVIKLPLKKTQNYNFTVKDIKCKVLCSKSVDFCDGACVAADVIDCCGGCAVSVCNDTECFDISRAALMLERLREDGISSLAVVSYTDRIGVIAVGDINPYEATQIGISVLSSRGVVLAPGRYVASVNGVNIALQRTPSGIVFYPEIKCIS